MLVRNKTYTHMPVQKFDLSGTTATNGSRMYVTPSGRRYASVTTALKHLSEEGIAKWRKDVGEAEATRISTQSAIRGTAVHAMCEHYLDNQHYILSESRFNRDKYTFSQIKPLLHRIDNIRGMEMALWSDKLKLAGRTDCIAEFDGVLSVIDFKTSLKLKKKEWITGYFMQETAYAIMYKERYSEPVDQIVTIIATDNSEPQLFIEDPNNYKHQLVDAINFYYQNRYIP